VDKGKARETGIIGFTPNQNQLREPPFTLPSVGISCLNTAELWPERISPNDKPVPKPYEKDSAVAILLSADSSEELGNLLFRLVEWMISPPTIDLTIEEFGGRFKPPTRTILSPPSDQIPPDPLVLISDNVTYSMYVHPAPFPSVSVKCIIPRGEALGRGPRRTAVRIALKIMLQQENCWSKMGDIMIPDSSPVADPGYWKVAGGLLALALLIGESPAPVSPAVIYALLSNVREQNNPSAQMDMSLGFIHELQSSKAGDLLPWMIIPPGQNWRDLPEGHRNLLRELFVGLGLDVSGQYLSHYVVRIMGLPSSHEQYSRVQWKLTPNGPKPLSPLPCSETLTFSPRCNSRR
jgi:hypothetical protein